MSGNTSVDKPLDAVMQIELLVDEEHDGERLDKYLAAQLPQYSREFIKKLISEGHLSIANYTRVIKPAVELSYGQQLSLSIPNAVPLDLEADEIPLDVVFEDEQLLVINKASGMLTHPNGRVRRGTLVNALLAYCPDTLSGINGIERPGIVHRLDRDTSGLMVVAKTDLAHRLLQAQLQDRTLSRTYNALAQGRFHQEEGVIDLPIGRHPKQRDKMAVDPNGRQAITHWRLLENYHNKFALLELKLKTGRTHQIRVHLNHLGHPIVGDPLYGTGLENQVKAFARGQVLQSVAIAFKHPVTDALMSFDIPRDERFEAALSVL